MSQVLSMAKRLQEAEQTIAELREAAAKAAASSASPAQVQAGPAPPRPSRDRGGSSIPALSPARQSVPRMDRDAPPLASDEDAQADDTEDLSGNSTPKELLLDLSLDENGKICYYGPTSAVHDPPSLESPSPHASGNPDLLTDKSRIRSMLVAKSHESRMWEDFALGAAAAQSDIPRPVITKLLHIHWTWISPMFMWVYRPAFMREPAWFNDFS